MFVHKRCIPADTEVLLGVDNAQFGYCDQCGNQGTVFWVLGSEREYYYRKGGVQYRAKWHPTKKQYVKELDAGPRSVPKFGEEKEDAGKDFLDARALEKGMNWTAGEEGESIPSDKDEFIKAVKEGLPKVVDNILNLEAESIPEMPKVKRKEYTVVEEVEVEGESIPEVEPDSELQAIVDEVVEELEAETPLESEPEESDTPKQAEPQETPEEPEKALEDLTKEELLEMLREAEKE